MFFHRGLRKCHPIGITDSFHGSRHIFASAVLSPAQLQRHQMVDMICRAGGTTVLETRWDVIPNHNLYCAWFETARILNLQQFGDLLLELSILLDGVPTETIHARLTAGSNYGHLAR